MEQCQAHLGLSLSSVKPFWRHHHRHIHGRVSMVILKPVRLMTKRKYLRVILDPGTCWKIILYIAETQPTAKTFKGSHRDQAKAKLASYVSLVGMKSTNLPLLQTG